MQRVLSNEPAAADPAPEAVELALLRQPASHTPSSKGQAAPDTAERYACKAQGFLAMPAGPRTVGTYLASLGETHAPNTIRRRLSTIGSAHQYNSLDWNPGHRGI